MQDFGEYANAVAGSLQSSEVAKSLMDQLNAEGRAKVAPLETIGTILGIKAGEQAFSKLSNLGKSLFEQGKSKVADMASEKLDELKSTVQSKLQSVKDLAQDKMGELQDKLGDVKDLAQDKMGELQDTIGDRMNQLNDSITDNYKDLQQPDTFEMQPLTDFIDPEEIPTQEEALQQLASQPKVPMDDPSLFPEGSGAPQTGEMVSQAPEQVSANLSESLLPENISENIAPIASENLLPTVGEGLSSVAGRLAGLAEGASDAIGGVSEGISASADVAGSIAGEVAGDVLGTVSSALGPLGLITGILGGLIPSLIPDHDTPAPLNPSTQFL